MGQYTEFYFRAKLAFTTPAAVKTLLQHKFDRTGWVDGSYAWPVSDNDPGDDPVEAPAGISWQGYGELPELHPFFLLPRAFEIPYANNWSNKDYPRRFVQHPDGGCTIGFGCEFKNYDQEIQQFIDWLTPYVRFRFGKRNRGRQRIWVGWIKYEEARERTNIFIVLDQAARQPQREVYYDYRS